jgi:glutamate synthase (NADPH/NADH) small chain
MLRFVADAQQPPEKRPAGTRARDFGEVYAGYAAAKAAEQASRCSQCGVPFCQVHCPLSNNIPDWLKLTAEGRLEEAYALSASTNAMPEICGRICPQDRLCEGNCVIEQSGHGTVTIGAIEKYLTETAWAEGWVQPVKPRRLLNASVGIIGAGPAGLAAAEALRITGYKVTVYDRHDRAGGLLIYGIPNFKLEKDVVARRVRRLEDGGVTFKLGTNVTSLADMRARHDVVLIAAGTYRAKELDAPGGHLKHIIPALEYLIASNRRGLGDDVPAGQLDAKNKRVAVIGGGDTAMDCVRTAVRQGAKSVTCLYRRDRENMPGSLREVANAEEEGVVFEWLSVPKGFAARGVRIARARLGQPDTSGRRTPQEIDGSEDLFAAGLVIKALGFDAEDLPRLLDAPGLGVSKSGTLAVDRDLATTMEGVFAAGDIVRGASLVVWAIKDGRDAAASIHRYLKAKTPMLEAAQ